MAGVIESFDLGNTVDKFSQQLNTAQSNARSATRMSAVSQLVVVAAIVLLGYVAYQGYIIASTAGPAPGEDKSN